MKVSAKDLVRTLFQAAMDGGPTEQPISLQPYLNRLSANSDEKLSLCDYESLRHELFTEFQFLGPMVSLDIAPDSVSRAGWEAAVRWVLNALQNWEANKANSINLLSVLLSTINALDARSAGLESIATQFTSSHLKAGLLRVVASTEAIPGFKDSHFAQLRQELESVTRNDNYERMGQLIRHARAIPSPDFWSAVVILCKLDPSALANAVAIKNDVLFSLLVCVVLEIKAAKFALEVPNTAFKFVSISYLRDNNLINETQEDLVNIRRNLLLQVAQSSDSAWAGWMRALFKYPGNDPLLDTALAYALIELDESHWAAFLKALPLHFSSSAAPVATIITQFMNAYKGTNHKSIWTIAYQVWSDWNYGKGESQTCMFSPAACALDLPVAMYYSCLPSSELSAEEIRLEEAIDTVEQLWFDSITNLITERNRLLSRLRLIQHAIAIAAKSTQLLQLPPPILPNGDLYARTRYHYHDVNSVY